MLGTGSAAVMVRLWNLMSGEEEAGQQERLQPWATKELTLSSSEMFLEETIGTALAGTRGPGDLVDIQESLSPGSRMIHPNKQRNQAKGIRLIKTPLITEA